MSSIQLIIYVQMKFEIRQYILWDMFYVYFLIFKCKFQYHLDGPHNMLLVALKYFIVPSNFIFSYVTRPVCKILFYF